MGLVEQGSPNAIQKGWLWLLPFQIQPSLDWGPLYLALYLGSQVKWTA